MPTGPEAKKAVVSGGDAVWPQTPINVVDGDGRAASDGTITGTYPSPYRCRQTGRWFRI